MKKYIYSFILLFFVFGLQAQKNISQAEYFWDTDPGEGSAIALLAADGNFDAALESVIQTGINKPSVGLHKFSIRVKDANGVWGPVFSNIVSIDQTLTPGAISLSQAEYFWDTDPGEGSGTALLAVDGNFDSALESVIKTGINKPSVGLHKFSIRVKDSNGIWGPVFSNIVSIDQTLTPGAVSLSQAEYFWDADPGEGSGTTLLAVDGNFDSAIESVFKTGITIAQPIGYHVFNMRLKDSNGVWGPVFKNVIYVETTLGTAENAIANEYFVYPNPASDKITINKEVNGIVIFDLNGRQLNTTFVNNEIDISNLASGTYILQVTTLEGTIFNKKVVKK